MSDYWDGRAMTWEGAQRAAWDEDTPDRHCRDVLTSFLPRAWPVVEIGCGPGRLLDGETIGVDSSPNMVRWALAAGHAAVLGDGLHLPFPDESVTAVFSVLMFQHVPSDVVASYCREAWRILKGGGVFVCQFVTSGDVGPNNFPRTTAEMVRLFGPEWPNGHIQLDTKYPEWSWVRCVK